MLLCSGKLEVIFRYQKQNVYEACRKTKNKSEMSSREDRIAEDLNEVVKFEQADVIIKWFRHEYKGVTEERA